MPLLFGLVPVAFVLACIGTYLYSRRDWEKEQAPRLAVLAVAREGLAQPPPGVAGPPLAGPLSGRPALAWHLDVVTRERRQNGNIEEIPNVTIFASSTSMFTPGGHVPPEAAHACGCPGTACSGSVPSPMPGRRSRCPWGTSSSRAR